MNLSRFLDHFAARRMGKRGGKARALKLRQPIRAKTIELRRELNLGDHPGLRAG